MKKVIGAIFAVISVGILAFIGLGIYPEQKQSESNFLRLHVRANSNSETDQEVKYIVKQNIVNELTPMFVGVTTKLQAMQALESNLSLIEYVANTTLADHGFDYTAKVAIKTEQFPTRSYNDVVLPEGIYDALIVELGSGTGDNWWCVVYPPLCFLENNIGGDSGVKYRSKLQEIIKKYF